MMRIDLKLVLGIIVAICACFGPRMLATGDRDEIGPPGRTGATGRTGSPGDPGPEGPEGRTGSIGATGATGSTGIPGLKGASGAPGPTGAVGPSKMGPAGPPGSPGLPGRDGRDGNPGRDGKMDYVYQGSSTTGKKDGVQTGLLGSQTTYELMMLIWVTLLTAVVTGQLIYQCTRCAWKPKQKIGSPSSPQENPVYETPINC